MHFLTGVPRAPAAGRALGHLPRYPGSVLFVTGLNLVLARHLHPDTLQRLEQRQLRIEVADAGLAFDYTWRDGAFRALRGSVAEPDLVFRATAWDFYCLLQRVEDPDTLFFSRRLVIEGDTELGLMVKNTLDSIDMSVFQPRRVAADVLGGLRGRLPGPGFLKGRAAS
ncbi:SCP2 domain-containing protein [Castellaniella sp.]|uniref:ubiquinone anaerobic biosynthesis accessory factor UbiT n=1 Tax=Castellaniella sp. TaxID=1955812 RepID=UPI00356A71AF